METFGQFVKEKRADCRLSLREFCRLTQNDPSNWSKVERDFLPPPRNAQSLNLIAKILSMPEDSADAKKLKDLAAVSFIPKGLIDEEVLAKLPIFFRTVRGDAPSQEELKKLVELISK